MIYNIYGNQTSSGLQTGSTDRVNIFAGGAAVGTINSGTVFIYSGGANGGETNAGTDYVLSGGAEENETLVGGGFEYLSSGSVDEGGVALEGTVVASSGAFVQGLTLSTGNGVLKVFSGAILDGVVYSGGEEDLTSGLVSSGTMLTASGLRTLVLSGGSDATDVTVESGAYLQQFFGGCTDAQVSSGGSLEVDFGTESGAQIFSGGGEYVQGGASFGGDTIYGGGKLSLVDLTFSGSSTLIIGSASSTISAFGETLSSGAFTTGFFDTFVSGAALVVEGGYIGGTDNFSSGGTGTALSGGSLQSSDVFSGGVIDVLSGGSAQGDKAFSGGAIAFHGGASSSMITFSGGAEIVLDGYSVSGVTLEGGALAGLTVSSAGSADQVVVSSGGALAVCADGIVDNAVVSSGGMLAVSSGGVNSGALIYSGGSIVVSSGGVDLGDYLISGRETILAGGSAAAIEFLAGDTLLDAGLLIDGGTTTNRLGGRISGSGMIVESGPGTLVFAGVDTAFTGQVVISGGGVEFANAHAPGGGVGFEAATGATTLKLAAAATPASRSSLINPLIDFDSATKRIDLLGTAYVAGATAVRSGDTLTLTDGSYILTMTLSGLAATKYVVAGDGRQGVLIHAAVGSPVAPLAHAAAAFGADRTPPGALSAHEFEAASVAPLAMHSELGRTFNSL